MSGTPSALSSGGSMAGMGQPLALAALNGTGLAAGAELLAAKAAVVAAAEATLLAPRAADQVVIRAGSSLPELRDMATNGLRQLGVLLPVVERQLNTAAAALTPAPLGQLARAMGDAAHQVGTGFAAMASAAAQTVMDQAGEQTAPAAGRAPPTQPAAALLPMPDDRPAAKPSATPAAEPAPKNDPPTARSGVRPAGAETDLPTPASRLAAPRQAAPPIKNPVADPSSPASVAPNGRGERGSAAAPLAADPRPDAAADDDGPGMADADAGWRGARQILQQTSDALEQISEKLQPAAAPSRFEPDLPRGPMTPDLTWAMAQVAGAQLQVAAGLAVLTGAVPRRRAASARSRRPSLPARGAGQLDPLTSAVAMFGTALLLVLLALAAGLWVACLTAIGLGAAWSAALLWGWRVTIGARGLRIALRDPGG